MKHVFPAAMLLLLSFTSCKKVDDLTQFNISYDETFVIPSTLGVNLPFNVMSPDIESNASGEFESNNTRKDLVEEIRLTEMEIQLNSPATGDLGFLKSIEIFISAQGLPEISLAAASNIPNNIGKTLMLEVSNENFKDYIAGDKFSLRLNTVTDEIITTDHELVMHAEFFVDAKVLGI